MSAGLIAGPFLIAALLMLVLMIASRRAVARRFGIVDLPRKGYGRVTLKSPLARPLMLLVPIVVGYLAASAPWVAQKLVYGEVVGPATGGSATTVRMPADRPAA